MGKKSIDGVEIVEPPLEELSKDRGGFKRACFTSCVSVIFFVALLLISVRLFLGRGPATTKTLPENFPTSTPVYARDNIEKITVIPGKYKSRGIKIASVVPRVILSPLVSHLDTFNSTAEAPAAPDNTNIFGRIFDVITTPGPTERDTIQIEWENIDAEPAFVANYYKTELRKHGYTVENETTNATLKQFSFTDQAGISGTLQISDALDSKPGTDAATLIINVPVITATP